MNSTSKPIDPAKAAEFFRDKITYTTGPVELERMLSKVNVVDVREAEDFKKGHIPGSVNLPHDQWHTLAGLRKEKTNVLVCYTQVCHLAATAAVEFASKGFPVMEMEGGFEAWKEAGLKVEKR